MNTVKKPNVDIKIFVVHRIDRDSKVVTDPLFNNIYCGSHFKKDKISEFMNDDVGDNISDKRLSYCEMTVQYWVWKNIKSDYVGFCHYRRYLSFSEYTFDEDNVGVVRYPTIDETAIKLFGLNEESMRSEILSHDVITNVPIPVEQTGDYKSVYDYCLKNPQGYCVKDIEILRDIVREKYPDDLPLFDKFFKGCENRWYNTYIMKSNIFADYCTWLFDILFELEKRIDTSNYTIEQLRVFGVLSERLWGVYLEKLLADNCSVAEKQLVFFENTDVDNYQTIEKSIPLLCPLTNSTVGISIPTFTSLLKNKKPSTDYTIIIPHCNLDKTRIVKLTDYIKTIDGNVKIIIQNVSLLINRYRKHIRNTARDEDLLYFASIDRNKELGKLIMINPGSLVLRDLSELFADSYSNCAIAAPIDYFKTIQSKEQDLFTDDCIHYNYYFSVINTNKVLEHPMIYYVIQMNIEEYLDPFNEIINEKMSSDTYELDPKWGCISDHGEELHTQVRWHLPYRMLEQFENNYEDPSIILFGPYGFPWDDPTLSYANDYWEYSKDSPFYISLIRMANPNLNRVITESNATIHNANVINEIIDVILPKGSRRRRLSRKTFMFLKGRM